MQTAGEKQVGPKRGIASCGNSGPQPGLAHYHDLASVLPISCGLSSRLAANRRRIHASHTCAQATPGNLQKPLVFLVFLHAPPKEGSDQYHQPLTNRPKPFKNLMKMNNSTVRPSVTSTPLTLATWRPRWIPRGPPSKNIGFPCVSEGAPWEFHWRHQCSE